ncbi:MAG: hypothetical protein WC775_00455 [Patescibacteria group bacterium]|jgi:hypothetical protein
MNDDKTAITPEEATIVPETAETQNLTPEVNGEVEQSLQLDTLIKRYMGDINRLKVEMREQRSMFNDAFENDANFHEATEKEKEVKKVKTAAKEKIAQQPGTVAVADKVKNLREELKHANEMLSGYLEQYVQKTGARTIEDDNGNIIQIVPNYRLVKKPLE